MKERQVQTKRGRNAQHTVEKSRGGSWRITPHIQHRNAFLSARTSFCGQSPRHNLLGGGGAHVPSRQVFGRQALKQLSDADWQSIIVPFPTFLGLPLPVHKGSLAGSVGMETWGRGMSRPRVGSFCAELVV